MKIDADESLNYAYEFHFNLFSFNHKNGKRKGFIYALPACITQPS